MKTIILYDFFKSEAFYLTQSYGVNPSYYGQFGLLWHEGVDLGDLQDPNAWVRCITPKGRVIQDSDNPKSGSYGNYVVVWDYEQKIAIWYCHLEVNYVKLGQELKAGDVIGKMGASGNTSGKHLHFNLVMTDDNGNRRYNARQHNLGFLDPQYPADPRPPVKMAGVEDYIVQWRKATDVTSPISGGGNMEISKELYEKLVGGSTVRKEIAEYFKIGYPESDTASKDRIIQASKDFYSAECNKKVADAVKNVNVELANRIDQVERLKNEKTLLQTAYDELKKSITDEESSCEKMREEDAKIILALDTKVQEQGKTIGGLNIKVEELEKENKKLKEDSISGLSVGDVFVLLFNKLFEIPLKD